MGTMAEERSGIISDDDDDDGGADDAGAASAAAAWALDAAPRPSFAAQLL